MKLSTLRLYITSLIEPIVQSGAPADSAEGLRRSTNLLASFGELSIGEFANLLQQAKDYQETKTHAFPSFVQPIINCYERIKGLKSQATLPDVNREELHRDLQAVSFDAIEEKDLIKMVSSFGWELPPKPKKTHAISAIWRNITGQEPPKQRRAKSATSSTRKKKPSVSIDEYAQKVNDLKERAHSSEVSREQLALSIQQLNLDQLNQKDAVALARQLSRDVNSKTKKEVAIEAIKRMILDVKDMHLAGTG